MGRTGKEFSPELRAEVRSEQRNICAVCFQEGHLSIHHKLPIAMGGTADKKNALGVHRTPCHDYLDTLAIEYGITYDMIANKEYYIGLPVTHETKNKRH